MTGECLPAVASWAAAHAALMAIGRAARLRNDDMMREAIERELIRYAIDQVDSWRETLEEKRA